MTVLFLLTVFDGIGDQMESGSCTAIKLLKLKHAVTETESVPERRNRKRVKTHNMKSGFRLEKGTADAIFTVMQLKQKYGGKTLLCFCKS